MAASLYAVEYNGTEATGGNSLEVNLNQYYEVSPSPKAVYTGAC
jgi:hypothetical protein